MTTEEHEYLQFLVYEMADAAAKPVGYFSQAIWQDIVDQVPGRDVYECRFAWKKMTKVPIRHEPWTAEEIETLQRCVDKEEDPKRIDWYRVA